MRTRKLDLFDAEYIAHQYCVEFLNFEDEPMPPFSTSDKGKLESCLEEPFKSFGGQSFHKTLYDKAAVLFYLVAKNHCFSNGNKRMAVMLTSVFFFINKRWLNIPNIELYKIAIDVADSDPKDREIVQSALTKTFKKFSEKL